MEFDKVKAENVELQSEKQALINKLKRYEPTPNIMWSPNIWRIQKQLYLLLEFLALYQACHVIYNPTISSKNWFRADQ